MVNQKMLKYLEQCKNLELSIYAQTEEVKKLNRYISTLGKEKNFTRPTMRKAYGKFDDDETAIGFSIGIFIVSFITAAIFNHSSIGGYIFAYIISVILLSVLLTYIDNSVFKAKDAEEAEREYLTAMSKYNKLKDEDSARARRELQQVASIKAYVNTIKKQLNDTQTALNKLYALNIINENYQGMIPIIMFCEYFRKELCYKLEGPNGAYRLYENDLKWGKMYAKIDEVLSKLDEIRETQEALYLEIERSNRLSNRLYNTAIETSKTMRNIEANSVTSAENSRITAQNARAIANMELYRFLRE